MGTSVMATSEGPRLDLPAAVASGQPSLRFAWLAVIAGAWLLAGLLLLGWALGHELVEDVELSPYHVPFYTGIVALAGLLVVAVARAIRAGRGWRRALPDHYGILAAGVVLLLAWPIADIAWREGVGINEEFPDQIVAPSRLLIFVGLILIAGAPLRAALASAEPSRFRWPATASAALVFVAIGVLGFQPGQNQWVEVAESGPEDDAEVWAMNGDGSMQTRLLAAVDGFEYSNPTWSPDGSKIAYIRTLAPARTNTRQNHQAIWIADADGRNQRLLIDGPAWYWLPHWSPDGEWITFTIDLETGVGAQSGVLPPEFGYGQPAGGGQPQPITPNIDVWRMRADGSTRPERLTTDPAEDRDGALSPDGLHLVFDSTRAQGQTAVYVADADGSNATRYTFGGDEWGGTWSPSGKEIAFHDGDIVVTSFPRTGVYEQVTEGPDADYIPAWSPDGSRIAFLSDRDDEVDIWSIAADGSGVAVNLSRTPGADEWLSPGGGAWGPDGRIIYVRNQDAGPAVSYWVRNSLGTFELLLGALVLAFLVVLVVRVGAPFGAIGLIMTVGAAATALGSGEWRFVPAAAIGGLLVDFLLRFVPARQKVVLAAAGAAFAFVLGAEVTIAVTSVAGWSPTLLVGVPMAAALLSAGMAAVMSVLPLSKAALTDG